MNRDKLIEFVKGWHGDQKRKYTNDPYFIHLEAVANTAEKTGVNYGWEIGVCHDLFEDTKCTWPCLYNFLTDTVGLSATGSIDICDGVQDLTDVFTAEAYPYLNRVIRKQCEALRLGAISRTSQIIKCCDLIDNTASIVEHDPGFAVKYIAEKREILKGFTKIDGKIKVDAWNCLLDAEEKIKEITQNSTPK